MPILAVTQLEKDMVLCKDVKSMQGRLLLNAGTILDDKHIKIMKTWGITVAAVEGEEDDPIEQIDFTAEELKTAEALLKPIFKHTDIGHPLIKLLFTESVKYHAKRKDGDNNG